MVPGPPHLSKRGPLFSIPWDRLLPVLGSQMYPCRPPSDPDLKERLSGPAPLPSPSTHIPELSSTPLQPPAEPRGACEPRPGIPTYLVSQPWILPRSLSFSTSQGLVLSSACASPSVDSDQVLLGLLEMCMCSSLSSSPHRGAETPQPTPRNW